ncbi:MAG: polymorphic toxin type 47 domain-containing protein [Pseudomonadota bacterium]|nr:polymorphic toxin type 47 domain-containing protein [Pseudomonadota bacterium]
MFELLKRIRKVKGAGYSEIMLVLSLISMISVASFKTFGHTAQHQVSGLSYELSGQTYQELSDRNSESESATTNAGSSANAQSQPHSSTAGLASASSNSSTSADTTSQSSNDRVLTPVEPSSSDANTSTTTQDSTTAANQSSPSSAGATQIGTSNQEENLIETLARNVTEFSSGFATGLKQQGTDLLNMFLHPVQTVKDMAALVTMLKDDPKQVLTAMLEELGEDAKKLLSGDARNIGEVAGKYFTPAMITKVVTKLKALGKAANKASANDIDRTPSCCCFAKGTPVSTPEGFKAIDQLRIGDLVQSMNEFTGEIQPKPVSNLFLTKGKQLYALTTLNSNGLQETVEVTDNHPYWVEGEWIESAKLKQGMVLTDEAGHKVEVVELQKLGKTQDTYNIEVADFHTYFVGESKVLVHNECSCKLRYEIKPQDKDWRGTGKTYKDALDDAFKETGLDKVGFEVTTWSKSKDGKSFPVEYRHKSGAEVNIDYPHQKNGPDAPHVGWQTPGKRGNGGAVRGHIILDEVPYGR